VTLGKYVLGLLRALRGHILGSHSRENRSNGISYDSYDCSVRAALAEQLFETHEKEQPLGTIGRSQLMLKIIEVGFPTERITAEYFHNLEHLLKAKKKRKVPGQVLFGIGSGRSGSTSLTALLGTVENSCCTHENPPLIFWKPEEEQVKFHMRRFKFLAEYFALVADVSHWWLNVLDAGFEHFPDSKVVGMYRDVNSCTKSFMRIKRYGRQSLNHWAPFGNGIWASHSWDPTYPTYSLPVNSERDPDGAKSEMIGRYIREYNARLMDLAKRHKSKVMLVQTEHLNEPAMQTRIFDFANATGCVSKVNLNVRSVTDGQSSKFIF
jgi:hypothetical protein